MNIIKRSTQVILFAVVAVFLVFAGNTNAERNTNARIPDTPPTAKNIILSALNDEAVYQGRDVEVRGDYAYVAAYGGRLFTGGLGIIDISNPRHPIVLSFLNDSILNSIESIEIVGNYAYLTGEGTTTLAVVDITDPLNPFIVAHLALGGCPRTIHVSGKYAYLSERCNNSFTIIDISNPLSPFVVSSIQNNLALGTPNTIAVSGTYAYVGGSDSKIVIIDIANPSSPKIIGSFSDVRIHQIIHIQIVDTIMYISDHGTGKFFIADISTSAPHIIGEVSGVYSSTHNIVGSRAYLLSGSTSLFPGLTIIDISDPKNPSIIKNVKYTELMYSIYANSEYAYIGTRGKELLIVDISKF